MRVQGPQSGHKARRSSAERRLSLWKKHASRHRRRREWTLPRFSGPFGWQSSLFHPFGRAHFYRPVVPHRPKCVKRRCRRLHTSFVSPPLIGDKGGIKSEEIARGQANSGGDGGIDVLPVELVDRILRDPALSDRDRLNARLSGHPLAPVAADLLRRTLDMALDAVAVSPDDHMGWMAAFNNALVRDDTVTLAAMIDRDGGLVERVMPTPAQLARWVSGLLAVFYAEDSATTADIEWLSLDTIEVSRFEHYETRHIPVPLTPLVRAIHVGARRCVRLLVARGARPLPSVEALLAVPLNTLFQQRITVVETFVDELNDGSLDASRVERREVDWLPILGDLLSAFARSPSLDPADANPFYVLRATALRETLATDPPMAFTTDSMLERLRAALAMLAGAGYSPLDPISATVQEPCFTGFRVPDGEALQGPWTLAHGGPRFGAHVLREYRKQNAAITEHAAAAESTSRLRTDRPLAMSALSVILETYSALADPHGPPTIARDAVRP